MSFDLFTPNSAGSQATFNLEYQIGSSGTFTQLAGKSYITDTAQSPLTVTSITLTGLDLSPLNNQSGQVTLRLNNTATSGTSWNTLALDNFTYTASPVPEPSTFALLAGTAVLGLAAFRRRHTSRLPSAP
ncbi:MAG: PEP-CTERM sorting domain-containing protein [Opitutaceae bacterium]|nr:PEP-CTERM sorting domain-containing protein [Opitutaceae bacterium]